MRKPGIPFGLVPDGEEIVEAHRHSPIWVFLRVEEVSRLRVAFLLFVILQHVDDPVLKVAVAVGVARFQLVGDPEASVNDHLLPYAENLLLPIYAVPGYRKELAPSRPKVEEKGEHHVSHGAFRIRLDELPYLLLVEYVLLWRWHLGDLEVLYRPHHVPVVVAGYDLLLHPAEVDELPHVGKKLVLRVRSWAIQIPEPAIPGGDVLRGHLPFRKGIGVEAAEEMLVHLLPHLVCGGDGFLCAHVPIEGFGDVPQRLLVESPRSHFVESLVYRLFHAELGIGYRPEPRLIDVKPYAVPLNEAVYGVSIRCLDYVFAFRLHFHSSFFISLMMPLMSLSDLTSLTSINWYSIWVLRANASISS